MILEGIGLCGNSITSMSVQESEIKGQQGVRHEKLWYFYEHGSTKCTFLLIILRNKYLNKISFWYQETPHIYFTISTDRNASKVVVYLLDLSLAASWVWLPRYDRNKSGTNSQKKKKRGNEFWATGLVYSFSSRRQKFKKVTAYGVILAWRYSGRVCKVNRKINHGEITKVFMR